MPNTIKTRDVVRDIKTRNPIPPAVRQTKQAALRAKDAATAQLQEPPQGSPNDYAVDTVTGKAKELASGTVHTADSQGRKAVKKTYQRAREKAKKKPETEAPDVVPDAPDVAPDLPDREIPTDRRTSPDKIKQKKKRNVKKKQAQQHGKPKQAATPEKPAAQGNRLNAPKHKANIQKAGRKIGRAPKNAKNVKTAAQGARQTQQAAKAAAKSAKTAKQTAQRTAQATKQFVQNAARAVKVTYQAIKAAVEGTKALIAAIAAGGWVAVVIILLVCLVGILLASPLGIFFSGDSKYRTMPQVIAELSREYYDSMDRLQYNYVHDRLDIVGLASINWPEVLAVYAVKTNTDVDADEVVTLNKSKVDKLRNVLEDMNWYEYFVTNEQATRTVVYIDEQGQEQERTETVILRVLTIQINGRDTAAMADAYKFNKKKRAQLNELLDPQLADMWAMLLGGYVRGSGEILVGDPAWRGTGILSWPLQAGEYRITSKFGYRDNPTKPGEIKFHDGLDLGADAGTPILAAADGVIEYVNATDRWGYGYGYYVKLKHHDGSVTLYAHCSQIAVTAEQKVFKGQVIAFVGSTGNSTGEHLHFEVRKDGKTVNPLNFYAPN